MIRSARTLLLFLCLGLSMPAARAVTVHGQMTGFIDEQAATSGLGSTVFGLDGSALLGQAFTIDFRYDTASAPLTGTLNSTLSNRSFYESTDPALDWLSLSITVNGITFDIAGAYRYADIIDDFGADPQNFPGEDRLQLAVDGISDTGTSYRRQFLDVAVHMPFDTLGTSTLPTTLFSDQITRVLGSAAFMINEYDLDSANNLTYERYVAFNLDIRHIEAAVVPLPATLPLFAYSLLGLLLLGRKSARTA